jgi:hypothetical protein
MAGNGEGKRKDRQKKEPEAGDGSSDRFNYVLVLFVLSI